MESDKALPVPYTCEVMGEIKAGDTLLVIGQSFNAVERFDVNLHGSGLEDDSDIALQISFRYKEGRIVLNSRLGGQWGDKEMRERLRYKAGEVFDIRLRVNPTHYEVFVDCKKLCEYPHVMTADQIRYVHIDGEIMLNQVWWGGRFYPRPYEGGLKGGLPVGKRLWISGIPTGKRFHVNLMTDEGEIPFHFNPRLDEEKIIRNTQQNGQWQNEEREAKKFLFKRDQIFDLIIANTKVQFEVYVDMQQCIKYAHRMDPDWIGGIQIDGDVDLFDVSII